MRVYFDSSAFAKRYIAETGTPQVLAWCEQASELALSVIAVPELISAFCRLRREGRLTGAQYQSVKSDLLADIADALVCDTTPQVIAHAVKALESGPLRGMDAIHLGAALACATEVFISVDARQCHAAERFGLRVVAL
jgi:predicted nucleic acid-binding protein